MTALFVLISVVAILAVVSVLFVHLAPQLGGRPRGARLARIEHADLGGRVLVPIRARGTAARGGREFKNHRCHAKAR